MMEQNFDEKLLKKDVHHELAQTQLETPILNPSDIFSEYTHGYDLNQSIQPDCPPDLGLNLDESLEILRDEILDPLERETTEKSILRTNTGTIQNRNDLDLNTKQIEYETDHEK